MFNKYRFSVDDHLFFFDCRAGSGRYGFYHRAILYIDGYRRAEAVKHYDNRTWESFVFQSVMIKALRAVMDEKRDYITRCEKSARAWERLSPARRAVIDAKIGADPDYMVLKDARAFIGD